MYVETDPAELGFDAARLARIDAHFDRYVDDGRLPAWLAVVSRHGRIAHVGAKACDAGALWRIYSMTKPITSVAALSLWEEGAFELTDPIARFLPEFAEPRVYVRGSSQAPATVPAIEPIRMWHLLTHTAGLTYGFHHAHPVDAMYRAAGYEWAWPPGADLATACRTWAELPLLFQPGAEWNYSVATDVLGRVIEVITGKPLDEVFRERILDPLGMHETGFFARESDHARLVPLHTPDPKTGLAVRNDEFGAVALSPPSMLSGGGGLVSSAADYHRFALMLLGDGELDGVRILGSRTVRYMSKNHLPGGADLEAFGRPLFAEMHFHGTGFGLGVSVIVDTVAGKVPGSVGEIAWGGAASTAFWVDREEGVAVLFFTQLLPSSTYPIRTQLRQLVYQALA
jgi:CubicO group peptidase (beta-lactamase class C family)